MEKTYNIVYVTTNLINGKQYVGDHSTDKEIKQDKYLESGIGIKNAIIKYGKENFKREILEFFPTKQESFAAQSKYISEFNTLNPLGYNNDKNGGYCLTGLSSEEKSEKLSKIHKGKVLSEEHKERIRSSMKSFKHTEETKEKLRKPKLTKEKYSESKLGEKNPMYGISLYDFWVKKYGEEIAVKKENERILKFSTKQIGKILSDETRKKIGDANKSKPKHICEFCNKEISLTNYKRWHGENCKNNVK